MSDGIRQPAFDESVPCNPPDWKIEREVSPGYFRHYAHGYWRPFIVHVWGRTIIGRRSLRKMWANV